MRKTLDKFSNIDEDIVRAAEETYALSSKKGKIREKPLRAALRASMAKYEQRVQERIARGAFAFAEALQERTGAQSYDPGPQALREFASSLMMELPGDDYTFVPEEGDIIEVSVVGELELAHDTCPNCHHEINDPEWTITDRYTGKAFIFQEPELISAKVRVVMKGCDFDESTI